MTIHALKFKRQAISMTVARDRVLRRIAPVDIMEIALLGAWGYTLAEPIVTKEPIPHFRRSGMDGYAVRTQDLAKVKQQQTAVLNVIEEIPCGHVPRHPITGGTAARIMTGAMVPIGADAVVMLEMCRTFEKDGQALVEIRKAVESGLNITPIGEEANQGDIIIESGQRIGAAESGILASLGYDRLKVYRKPKVAIASVGTELLSVSDHLQAGKIRDSNTYMLASQIKTAGGEPMLFGPIPDQYELAEQNIYELLASDADIVMTIGGVSVGDYDVIADFFLRWEGTTLFNKLSMRPGSPTSAGVWHDKLLFGLSGNPSACFVGCALLVHPVLLAMQGVQQPVHDERMASLTADFSKVNAYTRYIRGRLYSDEGKAYVTPIGSNKSSAMIELKDINCLIVIPPTKTCLKAGTLVQVIPLAGGIPT